MCFLIWCVVFTLLTMLIPTKLITSTDTNCAAGENY